VDLPHPITQRDPGVKAQRAGVVDLGSNSVRLVVFEGRGRNPLPIFNEKAVLGLGRGLQMTGRLNPEAIGPALTVLARYHALAIAMEAEPIEILATAAVRDAENGPEFIAALRARVPGVAIRILAGEEEASLSADGVLLGFPGADGILGDIGGGSLELVQLARGRAEQMASLRLGAIRLAERAGENMAKARGIAEAEFATVPWLRRGRGRDLFLVGGAWRALARMHMAQTGYPLSIVHHYVLRREEARDLASLIAGATRRMIERMPGAPAKRLSDLPYAALVLRRLLRATDAARVVFSANGLREGWYARLLPEAARAEDPLSVAAREMCARFGRDPRHAPALMRWTAPLFPKEAAAERALREAACTLSDIGSLDHPDYRAEQSFLRILRQPGIGLDHTARAFLALAVALRYETAGENPHYATARLLLGPVEARRAELLAVAFRLAYTLSGGTPALLGGSRLSLLDGRLRLTLVEGSGVFAGEAVLRRLEPLAALLGLSADMAVNAA
jgi:exopolyphosphatase/guanosine-5'-triphosphate,3'-diphosphate pyrophosphatase